MNPSPHIIVVGAGVAGRLISLQLADQGCAITLIDKDRPEGTHSCTYVGAGMLTPWCERESASELVFTLGQESLAGWRRLGEQLTGDLDLQFEGSLVVAHPSDQADLDRLRQQIASTAQAAGMVSVDASRIAELEPNLAGRFQDGLYFAEEGQVNNRSFLSTTTQAINDHRAITWQHGCEAIQISPGIVNTTNESYTADWVVDCRGLAARDQFTDLRGVRGELLYLHAPEVHLNRPVRLMHPRHPLYIVPRQNDMFVIGATSIESEDDRPVTVRSALELLSAVYTLDSGFAEGAIIEQLSQRRPAYPDNEPRISHQDGLIAVNGLYRHGFLIAPAMASRTCDLILHGSQDSTTPSLYHGATTCTFS